MSTFPSRQEITTDLPRMGFKNSRLGMSQVADTIEVREKENQELYLE